MTEPVQAPSLESFFSSGGGKTLSWKGVPEGTIYTGIVKSVGAPQHATDPATQKPAYTRQGKPRIQVRIDLATDYRDPQDPEDDGSRSLYVGGWMTGAIGDAMRKAGATAPAPEVGATLSVRLTQREDNGPSVAPTNKFDAHYVPPSPAAGFFDSGPTQQPLGQFPTPPQQQYPPQPVQPAPPQQQFAPTPQQQAFAQPVPPAFQQAAPTPEQAFATAQGVLGGQPAAAPEPPRPAGITEEAWATMPAATKQQLASTMSGLQSPGGPPF